MSGLIVHEWLEPRGGAERVVDAMREAFPTADLLALWNDDVDRYPDARETWLARTPLRRHKALALPFEPATWRGVRGRRGDYDWALVSSHLFAHHADIRNRSGERVPKYVYAHTPARYIWEPGLDGRGRSPMVRSASALLKPLDRKRAQEPVAIAANSDFVRRRIEKAWHREATVIYPPVDVARIQSVADWRSELSGAELALLKTLPADFVLGASRFVPYKRLDLVIEAGEASGNPVVLAGSGPDYSRLQARSDAATVPVHFVSSPSDALLFSLYQNSIAYIFPAIEDFGIMPVEAIAAGARVVVRSEGGAAETVKFLKGGAILESTSPKGWLKAIDDITSIDRNVARHSANQFGVNVFKRSVREFMFGSPNETEL